MEKMYVIKRDGRTESVIFGKIQKRIAKLCRGLDESFVDATKISIKVVQGLYPGVHTKELDTLAAEISASMLSTHPDYGRLAARITMSNIHKETNGSFIATMTLLYNNNVNGERRPIISNHHYDLMLLHEDAIEKSIVHERDYDYTYFGIKTLEKSYLLRVNGTIVERPQYMLMRVAIGIHGEDIDAALETYEYLSQQYFIHATPTLFSAATIKPQLSSCYLLTIKGDSIDEIFATLADCAAISKTAGGIGLNVHSIRACGSPITGTNGTSSGLVPMLRVFNNAARYVDQGGGKRMGSFAIYVEPWHADIFEFLDLKKNHGVEENRARDLFYGLWIPDLFMERVKANKTWSLMCPNLCRGLADVWGDEFVRLYERYESEGRAMRTIEARVLWRAIVQSQVETGTPYMMYKDACNRKSNQQHNGTIKCSNLCTEIVEYTAPDEIAVCNLASLSLPKFVDEDELKFNFNRLADMTKIVTRNLNKIIDINYYPVKEAKKSNLRHRPIGIGVQGLADVFLKLRLPYESDEARQLNVQIFETIYHAALTASCELAQVDGVYDSYHGSPASKGILQFDMWKEADVTPSLEWDDLRANIAKYGLRNSLLVAPMPTASTAQILGNTESFEPLTSNIYVRRVMSGEYNVVNARLIGDLIALGLWNEDMHNRIVMNRGSVQNIDEIPQHIRDLYKTVWEISKSILIDMAADRGPYIDQSQSFSLYVENPSYSRLSTIHFYAWSRGLKTGMYYLRTKAATNAIQFTVCKKKTTTTTDECLACSS